MAAGQDIGRLVLRQSQERPGGRDGAENVGPSKALETVNQTDNAHAPARNLGKVADAADTQAVKLAFVNNDGPRLRQTRTQLRCKLGYRPQAAISQARADRDA